MKTLLFKNGNLLTLGTINLLSVVLCFTLTAKLPIFLDSSSQIIDLQSSREGSLAVVEWEDGARALIADNQYLLGSTRAQADEERQAHIGLLLHPAPEDIAFIGFGTGITAGASLQHRPVKSVTIMELSAQVADAANDYFASYNHDIGRNPRVQTYLGDARPLIEAAPDRFDLIVGDLVTPWRPGAARLFTIEHFRSVRQALRSGGVFCQWLPMHQLTPEHFRLITQTFRQVFPKAYLFRNHLKAQSSLPLALVGFHNAEMNWKTIQERCRQEAEYGDLRDPLCRHAEGLAMLYLGQAPHSIGATAPINTLNNLQLEIAASRQLIAGDPKVYFHGSSTNWFHFLQTQIKSLNRHSSSEPPLYHLANLGFLASRIEVARKLEHTSQFAWQTRLESQLPPNLIRDTGADWSLWAGSVPLSNLAAISPPRNTDKQ